MLEKHHTEEVFSEAVAPFIWEHEIDKLPLQPNGADCTMCVGWALPHDQSLFVEVLGWKDFPGLWTRTHESKGEISECRCSFQVQHMGRTIQW